MKELKKKKKRRKGSVKRTRRKSVSTKSGSIRQKFSSRDGGSNPPPCISLDWSFYPFLDAVKKEIDRVDRKIFWRSKGLKNLISWKWLMVRVHFKLKWMDFCASFYRNLLCKRGWHKTRSCYYSLETSREEKIEVKYRECWYCKTMFFVSAEDKSKWKRLNQSRQDRYQNTLKRFAEVYCGEGKDLKNSKALKK